METVEETTVEDAAAQAAAEDASARAVNPDAPEEEDGRFDVATDFELWDPDGTAECDGPGTQGSGRLAS